MAGIGEQNCHITLYFAIKMRTKKQELRGNGMEVGSSDPVVSHNILFSSYVITFREFVLLGIYSKKTNSTTTRLKHNIQVIIYFVV